MANIRQKRFLFIRMDRIGDLILTLPVDQGLSDAEVDWWIPTGLSFVSELAKPRRKTREVPGKIGLKEFKALLQIVREQRYDAAIVFHAPWWVSLLLKLAKIPVRGGVRSQWHSFLFLNRSVRQKRSLAEHSELEYNFQLVEKILNERPLERQSLLLEGLRGSDRQSLLERHGLKEGEYIVIHPGMGGSARNWPSRYYAELIRSMTDERRVVVTGTSADQSILAPLRSQLNAVANITWLDEKLNGPELVTILECSQVVLAPSTGVLHLAASAGKKCIGIYSPVRAQHPNRWGPIGAHTSVLMPMVKCPGTMRCLGQSCGQFDCMATISVTAVHDRLIGKT